MWTSVRPCKLVESMGVNLHAHHQSLTELFIGAARDPTAGVVGGDPRWDAARPAARRVREAALGALGQMAGALSARGRVVLHNKRSTDVQSTTSSSAHLFENAH